MPSRATRHAIAQPPVLGDSASRISRLLTIASSDHRRMLWERKRGVDCSWRRVSKLFLPGRLLNRRGPPPVFIGASHARSRPARSGETQLVAGYSWLRPPEVKQLFAFGRLCGTQQSLAQAVTRKSKKVTGQRAASVRTVCRAGAVAARGAAPRWRRYRRSRIACRSPASSRRTPPGSAPARGYDRSPPMSDRSRGRP